MFLDKNKTFSVVLFLLGFWVMPSSAFSNCTKLFIDSNYRGEMAELCHVGKGVSSLGTDQFAENELSSLTVPKGYAVEICKSSSGIECRTYFSSIHNLGELFNDQASLVRIFPFNQKDFYMVISSDPQYPWTCRNAGENCDDQAKADIDNTNQVDSMNNLLKDLGEDRLAGAIVNGDLTAFGHAWQFNKYYQFYEKDLKINNYPGLGNHDFSNNIDDCYENNCASRMANYLINQVRSLNVRRFDLKEGGAYYKFPYYRKKYENSMAYSWEIGDIHFVQLNNHPKYETSWDGWNFSKLRNDYFDIKSAMKWLESDLEDAKTRRKKIVLNYHIPTDFNDKDFQDIAKKYKVSAIFAGHYHSENGVYHNLKNFHGEGKDLPVILSGAAIFNNYILVRFNGNQMQVERVNSKAGGRYETQTVGSFPLY